MKEVLNGLHIEYDLDRLDNLLYMCIRRGCYSVAKGLFKQNKTPIILLREDSSFAHQWINTSLIRLKFWI
jgi:hypothetical protein